MIIFVAWNVESILHETIADVGQNHEDCSSWTIGNRNRMIEEQRRRRISWGSGREAAPSGVQDGHL